MADEQQLINDYDDEIDLKDLLRSMFATVNWVVLALVVVAAGFWSLQILTNYVKPTIHSYTARVNLVFSGVQNGQYPNGSAFSINDIIAPAVLNKVYDQNGLEEFIDRKDFVSAFSVQPYTPDRQLILSKYRDRLEARNLSNAEIQELQDRLSAELAKAASDSAAISFASAEADKIPDEMIRKFMRDVPGEWARHMVENIGVLDFDIEVYSDKVINEELLADIDYLIAFEMLLDRVDLLKENVDKIKEMPNGRVAVDDESGFSVPDLDKAITDIRRYRMGPLINPIRSLGIAKDPDVVQLYFENQLRELNRDRQLLQDRQQNVQDAFANYAKYQEGGPERADTATGGISSGSMIPQFGSEFLDRIVEMTNAGADIDYRQKLNDQQLAVANQLAETDSEIDRINDILASIQDGETAVHPLRESYAEQVEVELPKIVAQLRDYFQISNRIYEKLSREDLGGAGFMFRFADGEVDYSVSRNILSWANLRLFLILCFLTVVIVVPAAMIRNSMRADHGERRASSTDAVETAHSDA